MEEPWARVDVPGDPALVLVGASPSGFSRPGSATYEAVGG